MNTFTAITSEGINQFTFDPLIKKDTYTFLHFVPTKESPAKLKMIVSLYKKDNTFIEQYDFVLEIDRIGKQYNEHYIGLLQNGLTEKLIFNALDAENNNPLDRISIGVAVAKIKDGNDDGGEIDLNPPLPKKPVR
ncbi:MAG: hypothetical protein M0D53_01040 [Flavobacterium sp. JAD_PAG50586_2]|nr:MAG: hypothetical protein M0D53_01040 [Flavobacterium sp. JAD_PAG50586_2]